MAKDLLGPHEIIPKNQLSVSLTIDRIDSIFSGSYKTNVDGVVGGEVNLNRWWEVRWKKTAGIGLPTPSLGVEMWLGFEKKGNGKGRALSLGKLGLLHMETYQNFWAMR